MKTLLSVAALAASLLTAMPATGKTFQTYRHAGHVSSHTIGHRYGSPRVRHYTATTRSDYRGRPLGITRSRITVRRQPGLYRHPRLAARPGHYRLRAHTVRHGLGLGSATAKGDVRAANADCAASIAVAGGAAVVAQAW